MADTSGEKVVSFKKKANIVRKGQRKRKFSDGEVSSSSEEGTQIVQRERKLKRNPMVQSTSGAAKRREKQMESSTSSSSDDDEKPGTSGLLGVTYKSTKDVSTMGAGDQNATAVNETETDVAVDSQAQYERALQVQKDTKGKEDDKIYRGAAAYGQFFEKKDTAAGKASSGFVRKGPIRAPANLRQTVLWDYKADLCKDYKETGYCTFGDSCKFMHDRTDYKHGWELERDWDTGRYGKADEDPEKYEISSDEDELPFKCFVCRESFVNPVVTKCKHYFCEKCALAEFRRNQNCVVCGAKTGGVFNPAKEIIARMKGEAVKKRRRRESDSSKDSGDNEQEADEADETETPMEKLVEPEPLGSGSENDEADGSGDDDD